MHDGILTIQNDGAEIVSTNFFDTPYAEKGIFYLSGNHGAYRLLVPPNREYAVAEMRTGTRAEIVKSIAVPGAHDVVFEDGTPSPFYVSILPAQRDRAIDPGKCDLTVWTRAGKQMSLKCVVKR